MKTVLSAGLPFAVGGAKQRDAIAAFCAGPGARLDLSGDVVLGPKGLGARAVAFDDQDVAVRQCVESARVLEPCRKRLDLEAWESLGRLADFPADRLGNAHGRQQVLVRFGQIRVRAILPGRVSSL